MDDLEARRHSVPGCWLQDPPVIHEDLTAKREKKYTHNPLQISSEKNKL